ncbi:molybdate ABC transporter substrate-binding protein [Advenella sp. WQ 585]|uniref:Molybdate ABC transporter substrate-binding protein n=1 Tax=Advenella mandrilli TaxID=2800330 RepID=A0ABS1EBZ0_9BURK|nr:molybdate ABC transporter substrate-binding protein [Advenella mandrilli]MBK1781457.1 molybdate ABC transporter substrate-binding protein [Advenella mandrilli]
MFKRILLLLACVGVGNASAATITVSAAASLKEVFQEIGQKFEQAHQGHKIDFNFGGSGSLLQQIRHGAPVDVFASADLANMQAANEGGFLQNNRQTNFVKNELVFIVPAASKLKLETLNDLQSDEVKRIAIGNPSSVPAGRYTETALKKAGLDNALKEKTVFTQNVRQALEYVANANVEAGFVYGTDAKILADKVKVVFNVDLDKPVIYPIAVIKDSKEPALAQQFVNYVLSEESRVVFDKYGFARP